MLLINCIPEELIFASGTGIRIEYIHTIVHTHLTIQLVSFSDHLIGRSGDYSVYVLLL